MISIGQTWWPYVIGLFVACSSTEPPQNDFDRGLADERAANAQESASNQPANWWQGGRTQRHTGQNPFEKQLGPTTVTRLARLWSRELTVSGGPVLFQGRLFVTTEAVQSPGQLIALIEQTGDINWTVEGKTEAPFIGAGLLVSRGQVLVGEREIGDRTVIHSFSAVDGQENRWSEQPQLDSLTFGKVYLTAAGKGLFANSTVNPDPECPVTGRNRLVRFSSDKGGQVSSVMYNSPGWASPPIVADGRVYVAAGNSNGPQFQAFNAETLAPLPLAVGTGEEAFRPVLAYGGFLYGFTSDGVASLNLRTGSLEWSMAFPGLLGEGEGITVSEDYVFWIASDVETRRQVTLVSLNRRTGAICFTSSIASLEERSPSVPLPIPVNANGVVYLNSPNGTFLAIDGKSGEVLMTLLGDYRGVPMVANGHVYLVADSGISALGVQSE